MKSPGSICGIGVFYDGSLFTYAQRHYRHDRQLGGSSYQPLHSFLEHFIGTKEQGFASYKAVYASWHQGSFLAKMPQKINYVLTAGIITTLCTPGLSRGSGRCLRAMERRE